MIQKVTKLNRGFAFYPFYFIPSWVVGTKRMNAYIAHEQTHIKQQGSFLNAFIWWIKWALSKSFRWKVESEAFEVEIKTLMEEEIPVNKYYYINTLSTEYFGMISPDTAFKWVSSVVD